MIVLDVEQGSIAWQEARLAIPTASQFSRIVTPGGKPSKSAEQYLGELLAEWVLGYQADDFQSEWAERGKALEPDARKFYAFHRDAEVSTVGFCYRDDSRLVGASPDGLVGEDGLWEVKCPMPGKHLVYLARGVLPREYVLQVQGQLWVTGREWCDFMSFHPDLPPFVIRVEPWPAMQAALDDALPDFVGKMLESRDRLTADYGLKAWNEEPDAPTEPACTHAGGHSRVEGWCVHCGHESEPAPAEGVAP